MQCDAMRRDAMPVVRKPEQVEQTETIMSHSSRACKRDARRWREKRAEPSRILRRLKTGTCDALLLA